MKSPCGFDARTTNSRPGRMLMEVTPTNAGILLRIDRSNPKNPVRNVHVWMPGFENAASSFHPLFLERLKPFKVLRFMDWASTNNSLNKSWADRTLPDDPRQAGSGGVAVEYMIELCNELQADPWFCMPHLVDDNFVRHFAELVQSRLHPGAHIYVEWSNEAWNSIFDQATWVQTQAKQRGCRWTWVIADEAKRDWTIWRDVFQKAPNRIIRVAAGQHYNPWVCQDIANRLDGQFDAIACGAYFFPQPADVTRFTATTTPEAVLTSCLANIDTTGSPNWKQHTALADSWSRRLNRSIPLLAYEGGQHLTTEGKNSSLYTGRVCQSCRFFPRCQQGVRASGSRICVATKCELFMAFLTVGRQDVYGSWGHLQYIKPSRWKTRRNFAHFMTPRKAVPSAGKDTTLSRHHALSVYAPGFVPYD